MVKTVITVMVGIVSAIVTFKWYGWHMFVTLLLFGWFLNLENKLDD